MKAITYRKHLILWIIILLTAHTTQAIPMPKTETTEIRGIVVDWIWRGEVKYQEETQGLAYGYTIPSHYLLRIKTEKKKDKLFNTITDYSSMLPFSMESLRDDLGEDEILVYLPTSRFEELKVEAKLLIEGYTISSDDTGPEAKFTKIHINGVIPKAIGPVFPDVSKPEKADGK